MNYSDQLFLLIQSLTASEKRYFTLHAKQFSNDTKSNALKLFDALCKYKATSYDEHAFLKQNKGKVFCKNLAYEKTYLNELILKTMRSYHADKNTDYKYFISNIDIRFLIDKGLTDQAIKMIQKSFDIAKENQNYYQLLQLIVYKQYFIGKRLIKVDSKEFSQEFDEIIQVITERSKWYNLRMHVYDLLEQLNVPNKLEELQGIIQQIEQDRKNKLFTHVNRILALNTLQAYYTKTYNYTNLLEVSIEIMEDFELPINKNEYKISRHLQMLNNVLLACLNLELFDDLHKYVSKVNALQADSEYDKVNQFRLYTQYMMLYKLNTRNFDDIEKFAEELDYGIKKYKNQIQEIFIDNLHFNIILVFYLNKKYSIVQERIIKFYKEVKYSKKTEYMYVIVNCLEITTLYSSNAFDTAESLLRSWTRSYPELFKEEPIFKMVEKLFKQLNNPNYNLKKGVEELSNAQCHIRWEQLKGLVIDWLENNRIKKLK